MWMTPNSDYGRKNYMNYFTDGILILEFQGRIDAVKARKGSEFGTPPITSISWPATFQDDPGQDSCNSSASEKDRGVFLISPLSSRWLRRKFYMVLTATGVIVL